MFRRRIPTAVAVLCTAGLLSGLVVATAAAAPPGTIGGSASGVTANLLGIVSVGPLPSVTLPADGTTQTAQVATVTVPGLLPGSPILSTGVLTETTSGVPFTGVVNSASEVSGINLLASTVTSGAITAACSVGPSGPATTAGVEDLRIGGGTLLNLSGPNTETLNIPLVGSIVFNAHSTTNVGGTETASVTALTININALLLPAGSIKIGQASCSGTSAVPVAPVVSGVTPSSGPSTGGTPVTITGSGFTGATGVNFGTTPATGVTVVNGSTITAIAPPHAAGPVDVSVTTAGGTSISGPGDAYTYTPVGVAPTVTLLVPDFGPTAGGTSVAITGIGFGPTDTVSFGGTPATSVTDLLGNPLLLTATSPAHVAGTVDVTVTGPGGTSTVSGLDGFTFIGPVVPPPPNTPTVITVAPKSGPATGGTPVTITGSNFALGSTVSFGGTAGSAVTVTGTTLIHTTSPAHAVGTVDVTVTTAGKTSVASAADTFTFTPVANKRPTVISVLPKSGNGGTPVVITGTNFDPTSTVSFGGTPASGVTVIGTTIIHTTAPSHKPGTVEVMVTDTGGTSAASAGSVYTYPGTPPPPPPVVVPPVVTGVTPPSGPVGGGTPITITGKGFGCVTAVHVGAVSVPFTVVNSTTIRITTPAGTAGTTFVLVTTCVGTNTPSSHSTFTYLSPGGASGYWEVANDGGIFTFGHALFYGSAGSDNLATTIIGMAAAPDGRGYWLAGADGSIYAYGDAGNHGSLAGQHLNSPIVSIAATADGLGYWLVAADGGIFAFGDAAYYGSEGGQHLNSPIVGLAATGDGHGYWMVAADGGIFTFGDAAFLGSEGGHHLNKPVIGIAPTKDGHGYYLVATDGGIFTFGDAVFQGSEGGSHLNAPIVGVAPTPDGGGYWMDATDGGIFTFGDAPFYGSKGGEHLNKPMNGMAATSTVQG